MKEPILLLDASTDEVCVGVLANSTWLAFERTSVEALESLFSLTACVLDQAQLHLRQINRFLFCEGPGSVLGIRLAAMAIRTWLTLPDCRQKTIYAYKSLHAASVILKREEQPTTPWCLVIASRMKRWNLLGDDGQLREIGQDALAASQRNLYYLPARRHSHPPVNARLLPYRLEAHPDIFGNAPWLRSIESPDAWLPSQPVYQQWTATRHRSPF